MKRIVLQVFRTVVTVVVVGTMAMMIYSLRSENAALRRQLAFRTSVGSVPAEDSGVYVLCRFDLRPDADVGEYVRRTLSVVPTVRAEEGCRLYTLLGDAPTDWEKPERFGERTLWMLEKWDSVDALKAHLETPHMKAFGPTVRDLRERGTFHVLSEVKSR